jgi:hypothetical protein
LQRLLKFPLLLVHPLFFSSYVFFSATHRVLALFSLSPANFLASFHQSTFTAASRMSDKLCQASGPDRSAFTSLLISFLPDFTFNAKDNQKDHQIRINHTTLCTADSFFLQSFAVCPVIDLTEISV